MNHVIDELEKSRKYHQRHLRDNETEIQRKKESIEFLENANLKHQEAVSEIEKHLELLTERSE